MKLLLIVIALFILLVVVIFQTLPSSFYNPQFIPPGEPGELISTEKVTDSTYRILYHTENYLGEPTLSSGMLYLPKEKITKNTPIIAWAHGTVGLGPTCAPSKAKNPGEHIPGLQAMLANNWVVVATDYAGLGTEGVERYLIGKDEAHDVLNSVRAVRNFFGGKISNRFALWGHSQGGHAVIFSANLAKSYSPELSLVAVAAAAPAVELTQLVNEQLETPVIWAIGPEIATSWPLVYKNLNIKEVLSPVAFKNYQRLSNQCIGRETLEAIGRNFLGQKFFIKNPTKILAWRNALNNETPKPILETPFLIVQGEKDLVVLPNTTRHFIESSCKAGSNLNVLWFDAGGHLDVPNLASQDVVSWFANKFKGLPETSSCNI